MQSANIASNSKSYGLILPLYLCAHPILDYLSTSELNTILQVVSVTDAVRLIFFLVLTYYLIKKRLFLFDGYLFSMLAVLIYRLILDISAQSPDAGEDLARILFNCVLYVTAYRIYTHDRHLVNSALFVASFLLVGALIDVYDNGIHYRATGVYLNPNFLAFNSLNILTIFLLITHFSNTRVNRIAGLLISITTILLSKTRTAIFALAFFITLIRNHFIIVVLLFVMVLAALTDAGETVRIASHIDHFWTFDGRTPIWLAIYERRDDFNFIFGTGTGALHALEVIPMYDELGKQIGYIKAQNHYIQMAVEVGVVGLAIWFIGILFYLAKLARITSKQGVWGVGIRYVGALLMIQLFENDLFVIPTTSIVLGLLLSRAAHKRKVLHD